MQEITLKSEVAGTVYALVMAQGDAVKDGQELLVVESMKMEVPVVAPCAATVLRVLVAKGDVVAIDQPLLVLKAADR